MKCKISFEHVVFWTASVFKQSKTMYNVANKLWYSKGKIECDQRKPFLFRAYYMEQYSVWNQKFINTKSICRKRVSIDDQLIKSSQNIIFLVCPHRHSTVFQKKEINVLLLFIHNSCSLIGRKHIRCCPASIDIGQLQLGNSRFRITY